MSETIHRNPQSAWRHLVECGGLELDGRDEGLDDRLRRNLDPTAPSLDVALRAASMGDFTRAFFDVVHQYVAIFSDILRFFERADAHEGRQQWSLRVDDVPIDLEHFRKWLKTSESIGAEVVVPALDWSGMWAPWTIFREHQAIERAVSAASAGRTNQLPPDVVRWLSSYTSDRYDLLPSLVAPDCCGPQLALAAQVAHVATFKLRAVNRSRSELLELWSKQGCPREEADAFDIWSLVHSESDYWLRTLVVSIAAARNLGDSELGEIGRALKSLADRYPSRRFCVQLHLSDLESLLSLPLWSKRHELYAVWIATEIVDALEGHAVEIHHDNGRIEFGFRESTLATVTSTTQLTEIISERRRPLRDPIGRGRKNAVQPDYGIWQGSRTTAQCHLIVECKHYKKASRRSFLEALEDYARAFPKADVYLVNHGPVGRVESKISRDIEARCHTIAHLTPSNWSARETLRTAVRDCVGEPTETWTSTAESTFRGKSALVIDVSPSMGSFLARPSTPATIRSIAKANGVSSLVAVDVKTRGTWTPSDAAFDEIVAINGSGTELAAPIRSLLSSFEHVVVVTDDDGARTLDLMEVSDQPLWPELPPGIRILHLGVR